MTSTALIDAPSDARPVAASLLTKRLLYVTGKGGAGKTTVAAGFGVAAASSGRRALVCELAGAHRIARAFGRAPAGGVTRLSAGLRTTSIDPQAALDEWLRRQPGGAIAAAVLRRSAAFASFVAAAPGAKELVTVGKLVDLARHGGELVILDGPSTGHALGMLAAPATLGEAARIGPVAAQARELRDFLADPVSTGYVGVTLPEEMPIHEVLELEEGLERPVGRGLDLIVVDGVYPDRFTDEEADRLRAAAARRAAPVALRAALQQHRRARAHAGWVDRLRARTSAPVVTLPFLFVPALGLAEYRTLSRELIGAP